MAHLRCLELREALGDAPDELVPAVVFPVVQPIGLTSTCADGSCSYDRQPWGDQELLGLDRTLCLQEHFQEAGGVSPGQTLTRPQRPSVKAGEILVLEHS